MPQPSATLHEFKEQLKANADITEVVGEVVELRRAGTYLKGLCPFHDDSNPSFFVHPIRQFCKCFVCGTGGDVIRFVQEYEKVEFVEALKILARRYNMQMPEPRGGQDRDADMQRLRHRESLAELMTLTAEYYQQRLAHPEHGAAARQYLDRRGLDQDMRQRFGLGVAGEDWEGLTRHLKDKGYSEKLMIEAGVATSGKSERGCYDYLRGRLIFPIVGQRGDTIAFGGRILDKEGPKYLNTRETEIFHKGRELYGLHQAREALSKRRCPAVLVEGYMDVIGCQRAGIEGAVASMGTALTPEQAKLLKRFADQAVFLYDGDDAGIQAIVRGMEVLLAAGMELRVGLLPEGKDPDDIAREQGAEALQNIIAKAPGFFDFLMRRAHAQFDLKLPEQRARALEIFQPAIEAIADPLVRDGYIQRLAAEMEYEEARLREWLRQHSRPKPRRAAPQPPAVQAQPLPQPPPEYQDAGPPPEEPAYPDMEDYEQSVPAPQPQGEIPIAGLGQPTRRELGLLRLFLEHADLRIQLRDQFQPEWIEHPLVRYWLEQIIAMEDQISDVWTACLARCGGNEHESFLQNVLIQADEPVEENYLVTAELTLQSLEAEHYRRANERLSRRLRQLEDQSAPREEIEGILREQMRNMKRRTEIRQQLDERNRAIGLNF